MSKKQFEKIIEVCLDRLAVYGVTEENGLVPPPFEGEKILENYIRTSRELSQRLEQRKNFYRELVSYGKSLGV